MSTLEVPKNLVVPAVTFASLTLLAIVTVIISAIIAVASMPKPAAEVLMRTLRAGESEVQKDAAISLSISAITSIVLAFFTCCMVFAIHAQRSK